MEQRIIANKGRAQRLTDSRARALPLPAQGYKLHMDPTTPGFGVRIAAGGARSWIMERRVSGKTVRRTLGDVTGRGAISGDEARRLMRLRNAELEHGIDRLQEQRLQRAEGQQEAESNALTFGEALRQYVEGKRRAKDGKALKDRTQTDYLAMVKPGGVAKNGRPFTDGMLHAIEGLPIAKLTGDTLRTVHAEAMKRGTRQATYAAQVLRAVLRWHGAKIEGNPFDRDTPGRDRISLPQARPNPTPIPPERLGDWWHAACLAGDAEIGGSVDAGETLRFLLLTGCRGVEVRGITVADVDVKGARVTLRDTKSRTDHTLHLSRQALAIVAPRVHLRKAKDRVFPVDDLRKTLAGINAAAETSVSGHDLRATFASVAEELVSAWTLRKMLNHADPTGGATAHYIGKSEGQLRAGWQTVADAIDSAVE